MNRKKFALDFSSAVNEKIKRKLDQQPTNYHTMQLLSDFHTCLAVAMKKGIFMFGYRQFISIYLLNDVYLLMFFRDSLVSSLLQYFVRIGLH